MSIIQFPESSGIGAHDSSTGRGQECGDSLLRCRTFDDSHHFTGNILYRLHRASDRYQQRLGGDIVDFGEINLPISFAGHGEGSNDHIYPAVFKQRTVRKTLSLAPPVFRSAQPGDVVINQALEPDRQAQQHRVDTDQRHCIATLNHLAGSGMGEEQVAHKLANGLHLVAQRCISRQARRHEVVSFPPRFDIAVDELGWLVEGDPVAHLLAEPVDNLGYIVDKDSWKVLADQSAALLHMYWPGKVMQRHDRLHPCCVYRFDQVLVMGKRLVIELSLFWFES